MILTTTTRPQVRLWCGPAPPAEAPAPAVSTVSVDSGKKRLRHRQPQAGRKGRHRNHHREANEGYELDKLVVTGKNGDEIKLTNEGGGKYTFKMPASSVEIEASFAKIEAEPNSLADVKQRRLVL